MIRLDEWDTLSLASTPDRAQILRQFMAVWQKGRTAKILLGIGPTNLFKHLR